MEVAIPVRDPALRAHLEDMFQVQLRDTAKGRAQQPDGTYLRVQGEPFNAQEYFCDQAYSGEWALERPKPRPAALPAPAPKERPAVKAAAKRPAVTVKKTRRGLLGRIVKRDRP